MRRWKRRKRFVRSFEERDFAGAAGGRLTLGLSLTGTMADGVAPEAAGSVQ